MAVGEVARQVAGGDADAGTETPGLPQGTSADRNRQWVLTLLPTFPLVLLVLRLWILSRQDMQTMLLLVQYVNPLGLISALMTTLVWTLPAVVLAGRALGALLRASLPDGRAADRSWLVRVGSRIPGWVVVLTLALAALTWQMRFLPTLVMIALVIVGLAVRLRYGERVLLVRAVCVALPLAVALVEYAWLTQGISDAFGNGEALNALLLLLPPGPTVLLTGPVPASAAPAVTQWPATVAALLAPIMVGAIFLRTPVRSCPGWRWRSTEARRGRHPTWHTATSSRWTTR